MNQIFPILKREFLAYFRSPVAYVVIVVFLVAASGVTFFLGRFFDTNSASLEAFFTFHPWLYLFLIPAVGMRLWSEEKRAGTWELLFTLPISTTAAVVGKFLAAWFFIGFAIALTFPIVLTIGYLGEPDWGVVVAGYLGTLLMAGSYLGVCSLMSALTKNQVISFVVSVMVCFVLVIIGSDVFAVILDAFLPVWLVDTLTNFSFVTHFRSMLRGIIELDDIVFFVALMVCTLWVNILALER